MAYLPLTDRVQNILDCRLISLLQKRVRSQQIGVLDRVLHELWYRVRDGSRRSGGRGWIEAGLEVSWVAESCMRCGLQTHCAILTIFRKRMQNNGISNGLHSKSLVAALRSPSPLCRCFLAMHVAAMWGRRGSCQSAPHSLH